MTNDDVGLRRRFDVLFTGFEWVGNAEGTRWFFVMTAKSKDTEVGLRFPFSSISSTSRRGVFLISQESYRHSYS